MKFPLDEELPPPQFEDDGFDDADLDDIELCNDDDDDWDNENWDDIGDFEDEDLE